MEEPKPPSPERNMWAAILAMAIADLASSSSFKKSAAINWILDNEKHEVGSFLWICEELNIDPKFFIEMAKEGRGVKLRIVKV